jgi:UDP-GlcNAc:undecaprenyl-phosphate GlcNAc-1-phosphate transferase
MDNLLVASLTVLLTIGLIILLRPLARVTGLLDKPNARKRHAGHIPLVGGIAIYLALLIATLSGAWFVGRAGIVLEAGAGAFLLAGFVLVFVGMWDDVRSLSPLSRFAAQIAAALIMIYGGGVVINDLGDIGGTGQPIELGIWAVPFTVFVTVGLINAINMADGLDGLVGNLVLVSLVGLGWAVALWGGAKVTSMINLLSAGVIGFLVFNQRVFWRSRAAVFLGDAGSMLLGLALAWITISLSQNPGHPISPAASLWFLAVPVCDTVSVSMRRFREGKSPFQADARHGHHLFIQVGFSVTETITAMCLAAFAGVAIGIAGVGFRVPEWLLASLFFVVWWSYYRLTTRAWQHRRFLGRDFIPEHPPF